MMIFVGLHITHKYTLLILHTSLLTWYYSQVYSINITHKILLDITHKIYNITTSVIWEYLWDLIFLMSNVLILLTRLENASRCFNLNTIHQCFLVHNRPLLLWWNIFHKLMLNRSFSLFFSHETMQRHVPIFITHITYNGVELFC